MNPPVRALYKIDARPDGPAQARRIVMRECSRRVSGRTLEDFKLLVSLVNRLADRWGTHRTRTGRTRVCCESVAAPAR
jgi:hypothetical protein